jgi:hypothetical protein
MFRFRLAQGTEAGPAARKHRASEFQRKDQDDGIRWHPYGYAITGAPFRFCPRTAPQADPNRLPVPGESP